ncbi:hypothetical protein PMIN07_000919 [Paraphaeosphaeria minitans]
MLPSLVAAGDKGKSKPSVCRRLLPWKLQAVTAMETVSVQALRYCYRTSSTNISSVLTASLVILTASSGAGCSLLAEKIQTWLENPPRVNSLARSRGTNARRPAMPISSP